MVIIVLVTALQKEQLVVIVACMNLCINEAMRRQAAYRLAWDQRIERDWLQRSDNIIRVTVV